MEERLRTLVDRIDRELIDEEVEWTGPTSPVAIARVESAFGVRFPGSFRSFLLLKGGGGLGSFSISSVDPENPLSKSGGTVYGDTLYYRQSWVPRPLPPHLVVVQRDADDNEPFCLQTSRWDGDECPIVLYYLHSGHVETIAPNFLEFYERYLRPYFDEA